MNMRLLPRLRSSWRGLVRRAGVEAEMDEEFHHHLEMRAAELMRGGLAPTEAARQARIEFGHIDSHKEDARASRGLRLFDEIGFSWLDVKLGVRMLARHPGLSLVSVIGMAVAIAIGAGTFSAIHAITDTTLPLPVGDRLVSIQNDTDSPGSPNRRALFDFSVWSEELNSVRDVSAFRTETRNLIARGRTPEVVSVASMSPSGFRATGVAPVLGRTLVAEDDRVGAPPVLVIGYEEWRHRFDGDRGVVGHTVRLGGTVYTIVGVMPRGFSFPVNHHFWVPLRLDAVTYPPGEGPEIQLFGRLADGATLEQAQAEITTIGAHLAAAYPEAHARLHPRVVPYTHPYVGAADPAQLLAMHALQLFIGLVLVVVAVNVAMLIYARTVTRAGEIAVRTALGASRRRIVLQLYAEAFELSGAAALIGIAIAAFGLHETQQLLERSNAAGGMAPFWLDFRLTPAAAAYVAGLAVLAGAIVGVVPALEATGRRVQAGLQQLSLRGSRMELGRMWTTMIVAQVAVAVAIMPFILFVAGQAVLRGVSEPTYPTDRMLRATLSLEAPRASPSPQAAAVEENARQTRFGEEVAELIRRVEADPAVAAVTFSSDFPGSGDEERVEVESAAGDAGIVVTDHVAPNLFDTFGVRVLAGRDFTEADARESANGVIVDRPFVDQYLRGESGIGRRIRLLHRDESGELIPGEWLEIVGVVPNFTLESDIGPADAHLYRATKAEAQPGRMALVVRTHGAPPPSLAVRLRELAAANDPALQVQRPQTVAIAELGARSFLLYLGVAMATIALSVLLLSVAGIYAMMSFTVARRRREIGIRAALGANSGRVLTGIFARAGAQVGTGIGVGLALAVKVGRGMCGGPLS
jgi:predicted permease